MQAQQVYRLGCLRRSVFILASEGTRATVPNVAISTKGVNGKWKACAMWLSSHRSRLGRDACRDLRGAPAGRQSLVPIRRKRLASPLSRKPAMQRRARNVDGSRLTSCGPIDHSNMFNRFLAQCYAGDSTTRFLKVWEVRDRLGRLSSVYLLYDELPRVTLESMHEIQTLSLGAASDSHRRSQHARRVLEMSKSEFPKPPVTARNFTLHASPQACPCCRHIPFYPPVQEPGTWFVNGADAQLPGTSTTRD